MTQKRNNGGHPVLRVRGVVTSFHRGLPPRRKTIEVLKSADLEIRPGELVGLVGENGSGKSTLMQIVVGLLKRDGGIERPSRLGYCPQIPMVWEKLTIAEHFQLFARAYGLREDAADLAQEALLEELQFSRYRDFRVEELSGGTSQKLNLALALMHEPELLLPLLRYPPPRAWARPLRGECPAGAPGWRCIGHVALRAPQQGVREGPATSAFRSQQRGHR